MIAFKPIENTATAQVENLISRFENGEIATRLQNAGAFRFAEIAVNNFGFSGEDRPVAWPMLSKRYADVAHDGSRIPTETLTGDMRDSIHIESSPESAVVVCPVEYAVEQQEGTEFVPARPFFPMDENGVATEYATEQMLEAAGAELERILNE